MALFYLQLYLLAAVLYERMDMHCTTTFPSLPKSSIKTGTIHKIGQWIAGKRICYEQADIYNIGNEVGFKDLIPSAEYADHSHFFVLQQSRAWEHLYHLWHQGGNKSSDHG